LAELLLLLNLADVDSVADGTVVASGFMGDNEAAKVD